MKVLVVQGWVDPAGRDPDALLAAWPTLPGMAGALRRAGAQVTVVCAADRDVVLDRDGVRYRFVAEERGWSARRLIGHRAAPHPARTLQAAAAVGADVVHLHGLSFPRQARALRRAHPRALLVAQDHADRPPSGLRRLVHARGLSALDAVVATHPDLVGPFVEAGLLAPDLPVIAVPEGSTDFRPGDRTAAREATGVQGDPAVLWVGRMVPDKGPRTALEAVARCGDGRTRLWMLSPGGPLEPEVSRLVRERAGLADRVHRVGPVPHAHMQLLLRAADLLLAPSRREGGAYTVVESLACGTPVVASDIPAHRALLGSEPPGRLVPDTGSDGFAAAVGEVWTGREELRAAARRRFEDALSWDAVGRTLVAAYRTLLDHRERPSASTVAGEGR